ncbi:hypothetical protein, partial [Nocardioides aquaticus]|uniref:hypothetical protein n=1 Tax=Nocardioides aquaticus TaxID=160826 RepID=UPI0031CFDF5B
MRAACSFCGVPADLGTAPAAGRARLDLDAAVCAACMTLDPARPGAALRAAARLLGADEDDPHLREALLDEDGALDGLLYGDPGDPLSSGYRAPQRAPWGHVSRQTRADLE